MLADERVNIVDVVHHRAGMDVNVTVTGVEVTVETRGARHSREVLASLAGHGYEVERLT